MANRTCIQRGIFRETLARCIFVKIPATRFDPSSPCCYSLLACWGCPSTNEGRHAISWGLVMYRKGHMKYTCPRKAVAWRNGAVNKSGVYAKRFHNDESRYDRTF
ncbi:hypothetical protein Naga_100238g2 [Nannochloropsis gaditana]|uniref:Uncharacterized protein n=1 Tax=Nannochloropsis gaditana TaxID=72520 RepID=W7TJ13_9STRA|nr:hypothetical protein Naga_100238g2 [Nannochloropsis gaditana]